MAAPSSIKNFGQQLRDHLKRATDRADKLSADVGASVDNLHLRLDETESLKKEIDSAAADIQAAIGTPNGAPEHG